MVVKPKWIPACLKLLIIILCLCWQSSFDRDIIKLALNEHGHQEMLYIFWASLAVYTLILAIPFLPSIEIGFALMLVFGPSGVIYVYMATILGLCLGYILGAVIFKTKFLHDFYLRLFNCQFLAKKNIGFYSLIVLINLPGNIILGGGGGIAMNMGYYKKVSFMSFVFISMVAVLPLPLCIQLSILM